MKSKKVTMLAAVLVVAVVALAGIGYAAVNQYQATTTNTNNVLDSTYLTVKQAGQGDYTNNFLVDLYFDSENTAANVTKYTPVFDYNVDQATQTVSTEGTKNAAKISQDLTLQIIPTNSDARNVSINVTTENFSNIASLDYLMVLKSSTNTYVVSNNNTDGWSFSTVAISQATSPATGAVQTDYTVMLFLKGDITTAEASGETPAVTMNEHAGFAGSGVADNLKTKFIFTVVAEVTAGEATGGEPGNGGE